jgi:hypothetical protein
LQLSGNKDGQTDNESVKTTRPGRSSMAGFEVTTHGRFSSDRRGKNRKTLINSWWLQLSKWQKLSFLPHL